MTIIFVDWVERCRFVLGTWTKFFLCRYHLLTRDILDNEFVVPVVVVLQLVVFGTLSFHVATLPFDFDVVDMEEQPRLHHVGDTFKKVAHHPTHSFSYVTYNQMDSKDKHQRWKAQ